MVVINSNVLVAAMILGGIGLVGGIDYLTGIEIRIFPLYFLPLVFAAWRFGIPGALTASVISAMVWLASMYLGGRSYSQPYIWGINFFTQTLAFIVISILVAKLRDGLLRERMLAGTDTLTGLANSRMFYQRAEGLLALCNRNRRPVTLAYLDLDNFKRVNDTLGHKQGDDVLRQVTEVLTRNLRHSDVPARIGGDEFVILLPETDENEARTTLEKIREQLAVSPQFHVCGVTMSIGAVSCAVPRCSLEEMVQAADKHMYKVKRETKNRIYVETIC